MDTRLARIAEPEYMDLAEEARAYAAADFARVNEAFCQRLNELAASMPTARAVDLGTGPADIPVRLLRRNPGWRIVGADASPAMFAHARNLIAAAGFADRIELVLVDAKATPFAARSFDVVFSNSILHHITDVAPFWSEVKRVARPGAAIFLRDLARPLSREDARRIVEQNSGDESRLLKEEFYRSLLSAYTVEEVRAQLAAGGLTGLKVAMASDRHLDIFGYLDN